MDPSLQELLLEADHPEEELEVIMRLVLPTAVPDKVKVVAQFGDVITCRIKRKDIEEVYASPLKFSLKASKYFGQNFDLEQPFSFVPKEAVVASTEEVSAPSAKEVIVGVIDWGCDFTHPNFRNPDGSTRLIGIWDQSITKRKGVAHYGYGSFFGRSQINKALQSPRPFQYLKYHPAKADFAGTGAHGTHVLDTAAGNGRVGKAGMAPNAKLAFVHLSANDTSGQATLGDSVRLLEAIHFLKLLAGTRPLSINMSVGRHGGPHDGNTLVERAIDNFLEERPDTMICQSTGNYYMANTHASGRVTPGKSERLRFFVDEKDRTPNEVEVWYSGKDVFHFILKNGAINVSVPLGEKKEIYYNGQIIGRAYHRQKDPVNLKNHINIFLYPNAPTGIWEIQLSSVVVRDGRFHSWIERDTGAKQNQARFLPQNVSYQTTTGTICNGFNSLVVGAYDPNATRFSIGSFSSMGPTVDGRLKPDLLAPGVKIVAARSARKSQPYSTGELTVMSGTSMASPHVAGVVALILQIVPPGTPFYVIRNIINGSVDQVEGQSGEPVRIGHGLLNKERAIRYAKLYARTKDFTSTAATLQTEVSG
jgi:subtilisin family serine protease